MKPALFSTSARLLLSACVLLVILTSACGGGSSDTYPANSIVVNSTSDLASPPSGTVTLRSALAQATSGQQIVFDRKLNGKEIVLTIVGEAHSILKGETYSGMSYTGYADRDYGASALYAARNVTLDASLLSDGITIRWGGGDATPARVLAVYGDLVLTNVRITGGYSKAVALDGNTAQPYTLARGGGLAVWGTATLTDCTIDSNRVSGDLNSSRDRGSYGGGIYANAVSILTSVIAGNSITGYGAAGGGVYAVGGSDLSSANNIGLGSSISQSTISGNRITAQNTYGGGVFSLGGGPTNRATMTITSSTVARNLVEDNPSLPESMAYYYRGGGIYLGGGSLDVTASTIVENQVTGVAATLSGKPNMGGGGIAATIGNAHVVEQMQLTQSIVAGNTMNGAPSDVFTGSLIDFHSYGYNLIGSLDFSQILVPVPEWLNLNRKHYPRPGDRDGIALAAAVNTSAMQTDSRILSAGVNSGSAVPLWYPPATEAQAKIPAAGYSFDLVFVGYSGDGVATDDFLNQVILQVRQRYGATLGSDFGSSFGDMTGTTFYGPSVTWPANSQNAAWISFWRSLDTQIGTKIGTVQLGEDFWANFPSGSVGNETVTGNYGSKVATGPYPIDQRGTRRSGVSDIGAIEN